MKKLTWTMERNLLSIYRTGNPASAYEMSGHGGRVMALKGLMRRNLIDKKHELTDEGRKVAIALAMETRHAD